MMDGKNMGAFVAYGMAPFSQCEQKLSNGWRVKNVCFLLLFA